MRYNYAIAVCMKTLLSVWLVVAGLSTHALAQDVAHPALWVDYVDASWTGVSESCKDRLLDTFDYAMDVASIDNWALYVSQDKPRYIAIELTDVDTFPDTRETILLETDPNNVKKVGQIPIVSSVLCDRQRLEETTQIPTDPTWVTHRSIARSGKNYSLAVTTFRNSVYRYLGSIQYEDGPWSGSTKEQHFLLFDRYQSIGFDKEEIESMELYQSKDQPQVVFVQIYVRGKYRTIMHVLDEKSMASVEERGMIPTLADPTLARIVGVLDSKYYLKRESEHNTYLVFKSKVYI